MLNREEMRGLLWIGLFVAFVTGAILTTIARSQPGARAHAQRAAHRAPLRLGSLRVHVVDAKTGRGLEAGADVELLGIETVSAIWREPSAGLPPGEVMFCGIPAGRAFEIRARAPGHEERRVPCVVRAAATEVPEPLSLRPLVEISGAILSAGARPAAEAGVRAIFGGDPLGRSGLDRGAERVAAADSRGKFELVDLPPGRWRIAARAGELQHRTPEFDLSAGGRFHGLRLSLEPAGGAPAEDGAAPDPAGRWIIESVFPGCAAIAVPRPPSSGAADSPQIERVAIEVRDRSGRPVGGALAASFVWTDDGAVATHAALSDEEGRLTIGVLRGPWRNSVAVRSASSAGAASVPAAGGEFALELESTGMLAVEVQDESGAGVAGARLRLKVPGSLGAFPLDPSLPLVRGTPGWYRGRTGEDGVFVFSNLPPGACDWIDVECAPLRVSAPARAEVAAGERALLRLRAYAPRALRIEVADAGGMPIAGAAVRLRFASEHRLEAPSPATADASGRCTLAELPPPPWIVEVSAAGFVEATIEVGSPAPEEPLRAVLAREPPPR